MSSLKDKVVIITGAVGNLGRVRSAVGEAWILRDQAPISTPDLPPSDLSLKVSHAWQR